jgi:hypothetical protein
MTVEESKRWMLRGKLIEEFPDAKLAFPHIRVMKQHDSVFSKFWVPNHKIILDVIIEVAAVNVQKIDRCVGKIAECPLEGCTKQGRKGRILLAVPQSNGLEHAFVVEPGVLVPLPGIEGIGGRAEPEPVDRLAEGEVGIAVMRSEFDEMARSQRFTEPEGKRGVLDPG